jgi:hypothetical protein
MACFQRIQASVGYYPCDFKTRVRMELIGPPYTKLLPLSDRVQEFFFCGIRWRIEIEQRSGLIRLWTPSFQRIKRAAVVSLADCPSHCVAVCETARPTSACASIVFFRTDANTMRTSSGHH